MNLIRLLNTTGKKPLRRLMVYAAVSAMGTTVILAVITHAAKNIHEAHEVFSDLRLALVFVASALIYVMAESTINHKHAA